MQVLPQPCRLHPDGLPARDVFVFWSCMFSSDRPGDVPLVKGVEVTGFVTPSAACAGAVALAAVVVSVSVEAMSIVVRSIHGLVPSGSTHLGRI